MFNIHYTGWTALVPSGQQPEVEKKIGDLAC